MLNVAFQLLKHGSIRDNIYIYINKTKQNAGFNCYKLWGKQENEMIVVVLYLRLSRHYQIREKKNMKIINHLDINNFFYNFFFKKKDKF